MRNAFRLAIAAAVAAAGSLFLVGPLAAQEDLDCGDPGTSTDMPVPADDPHDLDRDGDGLGCDADEGGGGTPYAPAPAPPAEAVQGEPTFTG